MKKAFCSASSVGLYLQVFERMCGQAISYNNRRHAQERDRSKVKNFFRCAAAGGAEMADFGPIFGII